MKMLKEKRDLLDYIDGKTQMAGVHPPTARKKINAFELAVRADERKKASITMQR